MKPLPFFLLSAFMALTALSCSDSDAKEANYPGCDDGCGDGYLVCEKVTISSASDVERFSNCDTVEGELHIRESDLTNLYGLDQLRQVTGILHIEDNPNLTNLMGLSGLETLGTDEGQVQDDGTEKKNLLRVEDNPALPTCEATWLRNRLRNEGWDGTACIAGNLADDCGDDFGDDC